MKQPGDWLEVKHQIKYKAETCTEPIIQVGPDIEFGGSVMERRLLEERGRQKEEWSARR